MSNSVLPRLGAGSQQAGVGQSVPPTAGQEALPLLQNAGRRQVPPLGETEGVHRQSGESLYCF